MGKLKRFKQCVQNCALEKRREVIRAYVEGSFLSSRSTCSTNCRSALGSSSSDDEDELDEEAVRRLSL